MLHFDYIILGFLIVLTSAVIILGKDKWSRGKLLKKLKSENDKNKELLKENLVLAESIGKVDFDKEYKVSEQNILGSALMEMLENLKMVSQKEDQRKWVTEGLAKFANILRSDLDVFEMTDTLIKEIVEYTNANQGRIYFVNDETPDDTFLQLKACYAWDRNKYLNMRVELNEGLAGRCFREKDKINLTDVPNNYMTIKSGLGDANPSNVLILPIKSNEKVFGILEIATFKILDDYHVEFLEKLLFNIASLISNIKVNEHTQNLLAEMKKAQFETEKAQEVVNAQLEVLDHIVSISKTNLEGNITYANKMFCEGSGYTLHELLGKNHRMLKSGQTTDDQYKNLWETIKYGGTWKGEFKNINKDGSFSWFDTIIAPLKNSEQEIIEYMSVSFPIDEKKRREEKMGEMFERLEEEKQKSEAILNGAQDGIIVLGKESRIEYINDAGLSLLNADRKNIISRSISDFLPVNSNDSVNGKSLSVNTTGSTIDVRTEMTFVDALEEEKDVLVTLSDFEFSGEKSHVLFIQNITVDLF